MKTTSYYPVLMTGDVEGTGLKRPVIGLGLHGFGAGDALPEGVVDGNSDALVGGEELVYRLGVELG